MAQGVRLSVIKDNLEQTQISTTADSYGHVLPELQQEATAKLDGFLCDREADRGTKENGAIRSGETRRRRSQLISLMSLLTSWYAYGTGCPSSSL